MQGSNRTKLVAVRCVVCAKWVVVRLDPDDIKQHVNHGVFIQHAFVYPDGTPYLDKTERELLISGWCAQCWETHMSEDPLFYN